MTPDEHGLSDGRTTTMPLSRNLYELDEVTAALQLCLTKGWGRAIFWLCELVLSKEEELAHQILLDIWLRSGGGHDPFLFEDPSWANRGTRVMAASKSAGSLNAMRFLERTTALPCRPSVTPLAESPASEDRRRQKAAAFISSLPADETIDRTEATNWWISFEVACRQHSRTDAVWLLQAVQPLLCADSIWSAIRTACRGSKTTHAAIGALEKMAAATSVTQQILCQTNAVLLLCVATKERETVTLVKPAELPSYKRDWTTWTETAGRRAARIHEIPAEALHATTVRGSMPFKYTNIGDVRDPVVLLSEGCRFWQETLSTHGITVSEETGAALFPDDDVLEKFYEQYFPDDIPDEWSAADQKKSHGRGSQEMAKPSWLSEPRLMEEPVCQRSWNLGIHVRAKKTSSS